MMMLMMMHDDVDDDGVGLASPKILTPFMWLAIMMDDDAG